jgi:hypothetical protein
MDIYYLTVSFKIVCSQEREAKTSPLSTSLRNICSLLKISTNDSGLFVNLQSLFPEKKHGCSYLATLIGSKESLKENSFPLTLALVSERPSAAI